MFGATLTILPIIGTMPMGLVTKNAIPLADLANCAQPEKPAHRAMSSRSLPCAEELLAVAQVQL